MKAHSLLRRTHYESTLIIKAHRREFIDQRLFGRRVGYGERRLFVPCGSDADAISVLLASRLSVGCWGSE